MILDSTAIDKKLHRLALEVAEQNIGEPQLVLIGIRENGIYIAEKIAKYLRGIYDGPIEILSLRLNKRLPEKIELDRPMNFNDKTLILIDDVANSGKTMMYALKPLLNHHPRKIQTLALVARTHKMFPIELNFIGLSLPTTINQHIVVSVNDGEIENAYITEENI